MSSVPARIILTMNISKGYELACIWILGFLCLVGCLVKKLLTLTRTLIMYTDHFCWKTYSSKINCSFWICFWSISLFTMCQTQFNNHHNILFFLCLYWSSNLGKTPSLILMLQRWLTPGDPWAQRSSSPTEETDCLIMTDLNPLFLFSSLRNWEEPTDRSPMPSLGVVWAAPTCLSLWSLGHQEWEFFCLSLSRDDMSGYNWHVSSFWKCGCLQHFLFFLPSRSAVGKMPMRSGWFQPQPSNRPPRVL